MSRLRFLPHLTPLRLLAHYRTEGVWHLDLRARRRSAACPGGRHRSTTVHSSYRRTVAAMPIAGAQVLIHLHVRRFFCQYAACPQGQRLAEGGAEGLTPATGRPETLIAPSAEAAGEPHDGDTSTQAIVAGRALKPLAPDLMLHSLRHTFATWRLEMDDSMAGVQWLTGHADANTLMHYAHIALDPLADLRPFLRTPPGIPPNVLSRSSPFPPDR